LFHRVNKFGTPQSILGSSLYSAELSQSLTGSELFSKKHYFLLKQLMFSSTGSSPFFQRISILKCRLTVEKKKGTA
jgi:hypothetical protein